MSLSVKQRETLERAAAQGADARAFLDSAARSCAHCGHSTSIFNERIRQTIREAVDWFRSPSGSSDSHVAIRFIAALAEVTALQDALEYRVQAAERATAKLHGGDQTAG